MRQNDHMSIPAGWYPDPAEPETHKFWDGEQWAHPPESRTRPQDVPPSNAGVATDAANITSSHNSFPVLIGSPGATDGEYGAGPVFRLASHGSRFAARMLDIGILFLLNVVVNGWFLIQLIDEIAPTVARAGRASSGGEFEFVEFSGRAEKLVLVITVVSVALWLAYEVPALLQRGQTLGKRVLGIRVIGLNTNSLRLGSALRRWAVMGLPMLLPLACALVWLAIDGAWCLKDRPARQCLHDKAAATVVVDV